MSRHIIIGGSGLDVRRPEATFEELTAHLEAKVQEREQANLAASTPADNIPVATRTIAERHSHAVDTERFRKFHQLVREYLRAEEGYKKTYDPIYRRLVESIAKELDGEVGWLAADFAARDAEQLRADAVEGGGL